MKKLSQTESLLLNRTTTTFEIDHFQKATPKRTEIKKKIAESLKVAEELIDLEKVITNFGSSKTKIIANVYKSKEDLKHLIKKKKQVKEEESKPSKESKENNPSEESKNKVKEQKPEPVKGEEKKE